MLTSEDTIKVRLKKKKRLFYPKYIQRWTASRKRNYDDRYALADEFEAKHGFYPDNRFDIHHIDFDRENGFNGNLIILDREVHADLHKQLDKIISGLIKSGLIKFDPEKPHYYIDNVELQETMYIANKFPFRHMDRFIRIMLY